MRKNKIKSRASYIIRGGGTLRDVFACFIIIDADVTRKIYIAPKEGRRGCFLFCLFVCPACMTCRLLSSIPYHPPLTCNARTTLLELVDGTAYIHTYICDIRIHLMLKRYIRRHTTPLVVRSGVRLLCSLANVWAVCVYTNTGLEIYADVCNVLWCTRTCTYVCARRLVSFVNVYSLLRYCSRCLSLNWFYPFPSSQLLISSPSIVKGTPRIKEIVLL